MAAGAMGLSASVALAQVPPGAPPVAAPAPTVVAAPPDVTGVWIDHSGRGAIEIAPCGQRVCGYVYWVKEAVTKSGKPVLDVNNPDAKRRNKPICGTQILSNLAKTGPARIGNVWGGGQIYNPEEGANFDAEIKLISANQLSVLGYLGMKFMGETFTWTRAPADLVRCGPPRV